MNLAIWDFQLKWSLFKMMKLDLSAYHCVGIYVYFLFHFFIWRMKAFLKRISGFNDTSWHFFSDHFIADWMKTVSKQCCMIKILHVYRVPPFYVLFIFYKIKSTAMQEQRDRISMSRIYGSWHLNHAGFFTNIRNKGPRIRSRGGGGGVLLLDH